MLKNKYINRVIIISLSLSLLGLYFVYSSSYVWANYLHQDKYYYLKRQICYLTISILMMYLVSIINIKTIFKYSLAFELLMIILLFLTLIPGIGILKNGSRSWIGYGPISFQTSEIFKISSLIYVSQKLANREVRKFKQLISIFFLPIVGLILIFLQPDFGSALTFLLSLLTLTLFTNIPLKKLFFVSFLLLMVIMVYLVKEPYRIRRLTSFLNPFLDPLGSGFQIIQALYGINGSYLFGKGWKSGMSKHYYLPEPQSDFIFVVILEEGGYFLGIIVILLYYFLIRNIYKIISLVRKKETFFLFLGLASMLIYQVFINLAVVLSLLPVTGITLPFISYGGSSLLTQLASIGLIINKSERNE